MATIQVENFIGKQWQNSHLKQAFLLIILHFAAVDVFDKFYASAEIGRIVLCLIAFIISIEFKIQSKRLNYNEAQLKKWSSFAFHIWYIAFMPHENLMIVTIVLIS